MTTFDQIVSFLKTQTISTTLSHYKRDFAPKVSRLSCKRQVLTSHLVTQFTLATGNSMSLVCSMSTLLQLRSITMTYRTSMVPRSHLSRKRSLIMSPLMSIMKTSLTMFGISRIAMFLRETSSGNFHRHCRLWVLSKSRLVNSWHGRMLYVPNLNHSNWMILLVQDTYVLSLFGWWTPIIAFVPRNVPPQRGDWAATSEASTEIGEGQFMTPEKAQEVHERTTSERNSATEKLKRGVRVHDDVRYCHDLVWPL